MPDHEEQEHWESSGDEAAAEEEQPPVEEDAPPVDDDQPPVEYTASLSQDLINALRSTTPTRREGAAIDFMLMDLDIGTQRGEGTQVSFYGRCADGSSILVRALGWNPYLYMVAPEAWRLDRPSMLQQLRVLLEAQLQRRIADTDIALSLKKQGLTHDLIRSVHNHRGKSIMGYSGSCADINLLKITVAAPSLMRALRDCLHGYMIADTKETVSGVCLHVKADGAMHFAEGYTKTFNSNLEPIMQFMSDTRIAGGQWCTLQGGVSSVKRQGNCDAEYDCNIDALKWVSLDANSTIAEVRSLSLDIEVAGEKGVFPDAGIARWPVIQIAMCFHRAKQTQKVLLSLKECDPIDGATVLCFADERVLLAAFAQLVVAFDPDILTGYNINDFDLMYLQTRAQVLQVEKAPSACARIRYRGLNVTKHVFNSAQTGRQNKNRVSLPGRVVLDVFLWVRENYKLEGYSLKAVCAKFLKDENKEDVAFTEITPMWHAGPSQRKTLGIYCLKDAELPILLMQKLSVMFNLMERSRVSCMLPRLYVERGTMVRFNSQLIPEANAQGYVIPFIAQSQAGHGKGDSFQGATVLEPVRGMHSNVAVLDFASLYPSIMMAYNLCFSTIVLDKSKPGLDMRGAIFHAGCTFVSPTVRKGVVPVILERLVATRKRCKLEMEKPGIDEMTYYLLDRRQEALKISCNSIYGAVGCRFALLPKPEIAKTVTGLGRQHIWAVKTLAERLFSVQNGYERNAVVVGGDTDSVFVDMPVPEASLEMELDAVDEAFKMAEKLAAEVNASLTKPMKIEVEKVYSRLLLMMKKRYAGPSRSACVSPQSIRALPSIQQQTFDLGIHQA